MRVFKFWQDFNAECMNDEDLLRFATELWKDGDIKIEQLMIDGKKVTRYSIKIYQDEER
jgi:hypothetical protein